MIIRKVTIKEKVLLPEAISKGYEEYWGKEIYVLTDTYSKFKNEYDVVAQCDERGVQTGQLILIQDIVGEEEALK